jgi:hypothetical protein
MACTQKTTAISEGILLVKKQTENRPTRMPHAQGAIMMSFSPSTRMASMLRRCLS